MRFDCSCIEFGSADVDVRTGGNLIENAGHNRCRNGTFHSHNSFGLNDLAIASVTGNSLDVDILLRFDRSSAASLDISRCRCNGACFGRNIRAISSLNGVDRSSGQVAIGINRTGFRPDSAISGNRSGGCRHTAFRIHIAGNSNISRIRKDRCDFLCSCSNRSGLDAVSADNRAAGKKSSTEINRIFALGNTGAICRHIARDDCAAGQFDGSTDHYIVGGCNRFRNKMIAAENRLVHCDISGSGRDDSGFNRTGGNTFLRTGKSDISCSELAADKDFAIRSKIVAAENQSRCGNSCCKDNILNKSGTGFNSDQPFAALSKRTDGTSVQNNIGRDPFGDIK